MLSKDRVEMDKICKYVLAIFMVTSTGCAELNSIYRPFNAEKTSISIDAKQRVIISNSKKRIDGGVDTIVCAEPSPDALSAFAASGSFSAQTPEAKAIQAALSASESSAFIGLRTQTIQLLRDGMYRICEGYLGGALSYSEFNALQRRYQNLMIGLLAIEQLTGAVVPRPVALVGASAAGTGGNTDKEQADLTAAEKEKIEADSEESKAKKAFDDQVAVVDVANSKLIDIQAKSKKTPPEASEAEVANAAKNLKSATESKEALEIELSEKKQLVELAEKNVQIRQSALTAAKLRVNSYASGALAVSGDGKLDKDSIDSVARSVESILRSVISVSNIEETCLSFLSRNSNNYQNQREFLTEEQQETRFKQDERMMDTCLAVIEESAKLYKAQLQSTVKSLESAK